MADTLPSWKDIVLGSLGYRTAPPPAPQRAASALASVLSPSQVRTFLECSAKWWFRYGLGLPKPKNATLALGSAVHRAITANFAQKIETKQDLPAAGVRALFADAWAEETAEVEFRADEDAALLAETGAALCAKYLDDVAPAIEPAQVECHVTGEIAGVRVQGYVDVLDVDGRIVDLKTSAKAPSGVAPEYRFQIATYARIAPGASGRARLDTLVKTKTIKIVEQSFAVDEADRRQTEAVYPLVQEAARAGYYLPHRGGMLCSRRHCAFWRACEAQFGGRVEES